MFKKTIGYGILICVLSLLALIFIPTTISPSASITVSANQFTVQQMLGDIQKFRDWDPKAISDTTVSYNLSIENGKPNLVVTDSVDRIMANYTVEKQTTNEVNISVKINKVDPLLYVFKLSPDGVETKITWSMDFEGNLMMSLFDAEGQLSSTFEAGLKSFAALIER